MTTDEVMIYSYEKNPPKPMKEHTMNQDLTHRFLILIDRRQQSLSAICMYGTVPFPSKRFVLLLTQIY